MISGIFAAMATPFDREGKLMPDGVVDLLEFIVGGGVRGVFVNSSTGEALRMRRGERVRLAEIALENAPCGMTISVGVLGNSLPDLLAEARAMVDLGADLLVIFSPYYYRLSPEALLQYYREVIDSVDARFMLYNVPSAAVNVLAPSIVEELSGSGKVVGIKDSSGDMDYTIRLIEAVRGRIQVMQGSEKLLLPSLVAGGGGGVLGLANIVPRLFAELYRCFVSCEFRRAAELQALATNLLYYMCDSYSDTFLTTIKGCLRRMGVDAGYPKRPYAPVDESKVEGVVSKVREIEDGLCSR